MSLDINLPVPIMALLIEYTVGEAGSREDTIKDTCYSTL